jgi:hypothetical protein
MMDGDRIWKEEFCILIEVPFMHLPPAGEENHKKLPKRKHTTLIKLVKTLQGRQNKQFILKN